MGCEARASAVPTGLGLSSDADPALKRRAIFNRAYGAGASRQQRWGADLERVVDLAGVVEVPFGGAGAAELLGSFDSGVRPRSG
jgi:hypothetical protein